MNSLYRRGRATAAEVLRDLPQPPGYSSVRKLLEILESKGHVRHEREGNRYVYLPTQSSGQASQAALGHVLDVFFQGSLANAFLSLLSSRESLSDAELDRIASLARKARSEGR